LILIYHQSLARLGLFAYLSGPQSPEFIVDLLTYSYPLQNYNEKSENTKKVGEKEVKKAKNR